MANSRLTRDTDPLLKMEQASVDTDPGTTGYGCNPILYDDVKKAGSEFRVFYISQIGTGAIVTLQWKRDTDSSWTDYGDYTEVTRQVIQDQVSGIEWRAVVKDNNQGSLGTSIFGICW